jgi:hypothetical protein
MIAKVLISVRVAFCIDQGKLLQAFLILLDKNISVE